MEDIILQNYTLKYNPEDPNDIFSIPDRNIKYKCSPYNRSKGFDYIHKIVLRTRNHPEFLSILKEYLVAFLKNYPTANKDSAATVEVRC